MATLRLYRGPLSIIWSLALCLPLPPTLGQPISLGAANVLIYTATKGFRHDSIPTAVEALKSRSAGYNITFENTEDLTWFREDKLQKYDAIVFLSTTGESTSFESRPVPRIVQADTLCGPRSRGEVRLPKISE